MKMRLFSELCSAGVVVLLVHLAATELVDISPYHSTIVDRHNEIRREVGASDMQAIAWDDGLAGEAENWVTYCRYERAPSYMSNCGQNLFYTQNYVRNWTHIDRAVRRAVRTWRSDKLYFQYGTDCGSACAYAQLVWSKAEKIGCGMNRCPVMKAGGYLYRKTLFACFYSPKLTTVVARRSIWKRVPKGPVSKSIFPLRPSGDMTSDFPYTPGVACSGCPIGDGCEGGLCVPGVSVQLAPQNVIGPEVAPPPRRRPEIDNVPERVPSRKPDPPVVVPSVCNPYMSTQEVHMLLGITNQLRRKGGYLEVAWSDELEGWAKYVIRCGVEYPGPRTAYTNFGKCMAGASLHEILYGWKDEGLDTDIEMPLGKCRTPGDVAKCNHNTNMLAMTNTRMGCAACLCGTLRQLTCIYDSK